MRAVAVTAVLLFHAGAGFFGGGMLGVDVFFALSGYLITGMLLDDRRRSGSVHLGRFYARRARRLLPALLVLVIGVAAYANWLAGAEVLSSIRGDALSTLGYVSNWRFIFSDQGYFVHFGPPSPLLHTWSLAVEEQFYLVWPVVALFVMRRGSPWRLAAVAGGGAIASLLTSTVLFELGASSARLYYATDTRAQAILVGACLGALQPVVAERLGDGWRPTRRVRLALSTAGVGALGFVVWAVHNLTNDSALLYRGGFFLVATATSVLVAVNVFHPGALVARALSWAPLTYVGRISYGLYLYHWPIFLALDSQRSGLSGSTLLAARLGATFALAAVSFHFLEQPIRTGRFPIRLQVGLGLPAGAAATAALVVATSIPAAAAPPAGVIAAAPATAASSGTAGDPSRPVKVLLVGDSMGLTLGEGLAADSAAWGVNLTDEAVLGCDLDPASSVKLQGEVTSAAHGCLDWPALWATQIDRLHPNVLAIAVGRWEVSDRLVDGHWTRIGQPLWDDRLAGLLDRAITIANAGGAKVALFTLPYVQQTTEQPDGQPWDINQPARTDEFNAVLRKVAAAHPDTVAVVDVNRLLDPQGRYTSYIDGVRVRDTDDEHPSVYGGLLLRPAVLPQLARLGSPTDQARVS
ncbi:MAG TPA: acyltransferase family protein [Acidimicrobiales bacterium]|nr:acyltransferase family protein [Acidimicrobiales bacterium]